LIEWVNTHPRNLRVPECASGNLEGEAVVRDERCRNANTVP
jgi:hypothetical protein